jgi:hypothetical protein
MAALRRLASFENPAATRDRALHSWWREFRDQRTRHTEGPGVHRGPLVLRLAFQPITGTGFPVLRRS